MKMLNRNIQPETVTPGVGVIPEPERVLLDGGVPVWLIGSGTEDLLRIEFVFDAGQIREKHHLSASTVSEMLTEGTALHDAITLNSIIDHTGAVFTPMVDKDSAGLVVITLSRTLERVMELAAEVLFQPSFPANEFRMLIERRVQRFLTNRQKTSVISRELFFNALYGATPYGRITTLDDFRKMDVDIAKEFHRECYRPENMYITVAGKDPARALPALNRFFAAGRTRIVKKAELINTSLPKERYIFSEMPDSVQSSVRVGWGGICKSHPDFPGLQIANTILGGYFGSRLMKNIREDKGFTYSIGSLAGALRFAGFITIITDVANEYRDQTLSEIMKEINILRETEATEEEMILVKNQIMGEMARAFDGPFALAESMRGILDHGLTTEFYRDFEKTVKTITPGKIKELFQTYYNPDDAIIVIAGAR